jgi:serine/threonine protein kinase
MPDELQRIVDKAMAKNPDERYQSAKDLLIDLRNLKKQLDLKAAVERSASTETFRPANLRISRAPGKKRILLISLAVMALVTAGIFALNIWRRSSQTGVNVPSVTPAAPIEERSLTYWITVQKFKDGVAYDDPFTLAGEINFEAGYRIRVNVSSQQSGHLYVFNEGPPETGAQTEFVIIFPSPTANDGSSLLNSGQVVKIPERTWLRFDKQQGVEKLWIVFAADTVPELEALKQFANPESQGLITDVGQNRVLQNFLTAHSSPRPAAEKGETLTTVKATGNVLVYAVKLEHH